VDLTTGDGSPKCSNCAAIEVIADRIAHGGMAASALAVSFSIADEQLASHSSAPGAGGA